MDDFQATAKRGGSAIKLVELSNSNGLDARGVLDKTGKAMKALFDRATLRMDQQAAALATNTPKTGTKVELEDKVAVKRTEAR